MGVNRNRDQEENRNSRPRSERSGREDREAERLRKQAEQLRAARKRDMYMIGGFIAVLVFAVILISVLTKDTRNKILNDETVPVKEAAEDEVPEEETVIDIAGRNETRTPKTEDTETETRKNETRETSSGTTVHTETETEAPPETAETAAPEPVTEPARQEEAAPQIPSASSVNVSGAVVIPSWIIQDFLNISPRNRPGYAMPVVHDIVVHWVANPGTTAKGNRDYFDDLAIPEANLEDRSASAHFVVGLEGEIIQCIPLEEMAYANYPRNEDTISIEVCHPDWTGKYNSITYASLIRLVAYLCQQYGLNADHVIRHHDVSGKDCPKYYVEHPEAWEQLKQDVTIYMAQHPDILREFP